jgi:hypothetical protein
VSKPIIITVEGGVIQSIDDIPPGQKIVVMDFDTEGTPVDELKTTEGGDEYIESVYIGEYAPEPPAGTERYFEFYIADGRDKGSSCGFRTTQTGLGSPDCLDEDAVINEGLAAGLTDAADATLVEEISQEEYLERYDDGTLAAELAEEDRRDHKHGLYGDENDG